MSNYSDFVSFIEDYCTRKGFPIKVEQVLSAASADTQNQWSFKSSYIDLTAISMDIIAHEIIRKLYYKNSKWEKDSPASFDSFLIDKNGVWYFIEFKNQKVSRSKEKCMEKSYANVYWLIAILNEMRKYGKALSFDYDSPHSFFKENCQFILVINKQADPLTIGKLRQSKLAGEDYPENCLFLKKLEAYIFQKASLMDEDQFDREFVKEFQY